MTFKLAIPANEPHKTAGANFAGKTKVANKAVRLDALIGSKKTKLWRINVKTVPAKTDAADWTTVFSTTLRMVSYVLDDVASMVLLLSGDSISSVKIASAGNADKTNPGF